MIIGNYEEAKEMRYETEFHLVSAILKKTHTAAVLIGGFAVNYYNVSRQTADIDFLTTENDFKEVLVLLEKEGYKEDNRRKLFSRLKSVKHYILDIDFMFVDKNTLDKVIKDAKKITIASQKFLIPSLLHLIALKLHSIKNNPSQREHKDLMDIIDLVKYNNVDIKSEEFKSISQKYGTEDIYNKILLETK
ncbi:MAG: nucleotidyltransferase family protein [Candidatus Omnitrophica bacterium]|nr:nucleotidyltransferase family protein [Candidatus Omnitrophota bacterium]